MTLYCQDSSCDKSADYVWLYHNQPYCFCNECFNDGVRQLHLSAARKYPIDSEEAKMALSLYELLYR